MVYLLQCSYGVTKYSSRLSLRTWVKVNKMKIIKKVKKKSVQLRVHVTVQHVLAITLYYYTIFVLKELV